MVNYTCQLCNKQFNKKYNFDSHSRRKYSCNKSNNDINSSININNNEILINDQNTEQNAKNANNLLNNTQIKEQEYQENTNNNLIKCEYCNKIFTFKNNLSRHLKNKCKKQIKQENNQIDKLIEKNNLLFNRLNKLEEEINILKQEVDKVSKSKINKKIKNIDNTQKITKSKNKIISLDEFNLLLNDLNIDISEDFSDDDL